MDSRDFESLWPYRYLSKISNQSWTYTHNNKTKQKKKGRERGKKRTVLDSSLDSVYIRVHYPSPLLLHQMLSLLLGQNSLTILAFSEPHISSKNKQTKKPDNITKSQTLFCLSDLGWVEGGAPDLLCLPSLLEFPVWDSGAWGLVSIPASDEKERKVIASISGTGYSNIPFLCQIYDFFDGHLFFLSDCLKSRLLNAWTASSWGKGL